MNLALVIIHVVISVILVVTVLMQHGKQQGLSGAIAGGAETFFGKNKGRTVDAILKKVTAVVAVLFIISSLALTAVSVKDLKATESDAQNQIEATEGIDVTTEEAPVEEAPVEEAPVEEAPAEEAAAE
ncbi:MAG: preprotein translocase subunit SecG [Clostridia bacterium]|nr:preprotein translocase subunit SecG [Clostridia bacterium]